MTKFIVLIASVFFIASSANAGLRVTNSRLQEKTIATSGVPVTMRMVEAYFKDTATNEIQLVLAFKRKDSAPFTDQQELTLTNSNGIKYTKKLELLLNGTIAYASIESNIIDSNTTASFSIIGFIPPVDMDAWREGIMPFDGPEDPSDLCACAHYHSGQDYFFNIKDKRKGQPVKAVADGKVVYLHYMGEKMGLQVVIEHTMPNGDTIYSSYLHITSLGQNNNNTVTENISAAMSRKLYRKHTSDGSMDNIQIGSDIIKGDIIGQTVYTGGLSDKPFDPHLHFEIRKNKEPQTRRILTHAVLTDKSPLEIADTKNDTASLLESKNFHLNEGCKFGCYKTSPTNDGFVKPSEFIASHPSASFDFDLVLFQY